METHPEVALFVQTNPAFCCPSLITEAMKDTIREYTGVPIVTITYDGTTEQKNDIVIPYLDALRRKDPCRVRDFIDDKNAGNEING